MTGAETKTRIVEHAWDVLNEGGVDGFSLREVARRVGITPMAVYRHFADKEALLERLFARGFEQLRDTLAPALEAKTPDDRLRRTFHAYLQFATASPHAYALVFERPMRPDPDRPRRMQVPAFRFVVDRVAEAMDAGVLPAADPEHVALDLWALTHGLVTLRRAGKLQLDPDAFAAYFDGMIERQIRVTAAGG